MNKKTISAKPRAARPRASFTPGGGHFNGTGKTGLDACCGRISRVADENICDEDFKAFAWPVSDAEPVDFQLGRGSVPPRYTAKRKKELDKIARMFGFENFADELRDRMKETDEAAEKLNGMSADFGAAVAFLDPRKGGRLRAEFLDFVLSYPRIVVGCEVKIGALHVAEDPGVEAKMDADPSGTRKDANGKTVMVYDWFDYVGKIDTAARSPFDRIVGAFSNYLERIGGSCHSARCEIYKARFALRRVVEALETYPTDGGGEITSAAAEFCSRIEDAIAEISSAYAVRSKSYPKELEEFFETVFKELPRPLKKGAIQETIEDVRTDPEFDFVSKEYGYKKGLTTLEKHFRTWRTEKHPGTIRPKAKDRRRRKGKRSA